MIIVTNRYELPSTHFVGNNLLLSVFSIVYKIIFTVIWIYKILKQNKLHFIISITVLFIQLIYKYYFIYYLVSIVLLIYRHILFCLMPY